MNELDIQFAENAETRCPVVLLLDTSSSMRGESIKELNKGVEVFIEEVLKDDQASLSVELVIVSFNSRVEIIQEFDSLDNIKFEPLKAGGMTSMYAAIDLGLTLIEQRKVLLRENDVSYYKPWMLILTDGAASDYDKNVQERLKEFESNNKVLPYAIGIGDNYNKEQLKSLTVNPPLAIKTLQFKELFMWLSASVTQVSNEVGTVVPVEEINFEKIT